MEAHLESIDDASLRRLAEGYVRHASVLGVLLLRVADTPNAIPDAVPAFDGALAEAVEWASRWAVAQLEDVRGRFAGEDRGVSTIPLEALSVFHELASACAPPATPAGVAMLRRLRAIDDTLYRLIELRDRIEAATMRRGR